MATRRGVKIASLSEECLAFQLGIREGELLYRINHQPVRDVIDYMFYCRDDSLFLEIIRDNTVYSYDVLQAEGCDLGIELESFRIKRCKNNCSFCFLKQLPRGLRKSL